jgi:hypothetical protein
VSTRSAFYQTSNRKRNVDLLENRVAFFVFCSKILSKFENNLASKEQQNKSFLEQKNYTQLAYECHKNEGKRHHNCKSETTLSKFIVLEFLL